ncbi:hypothetical protein FACS1894176_02320 [Bacteroidia bacterium]|nr:hypothetical protein FACS1894176_02320 [Bacteroidia bacterium]
MNKILHLFVNIHQFNQFAGLARTRGINIREETDFNQILHEKDETHTRVENFDIPEINYYKLTQD